MRETVSMKTAAQQLVKFYFAVWFLQLVSLVCLLSLRHSFFIFTLDKHFI